MPREHCRALEDGEEGDKPEEEEDTNEPEEKNCNKLEEEVGG